VLDVLAIGSAHLPATSHVRSGLTRHRSALCIIVGASLSPLVVVVGLSLARTRRALLVFIRQVLVSSLLGCPTLRHWVHAGIIRVTMVGVGWSCLIRYAIVGETSALSICGQRQGRKRKMTKTNHDQSRGSLS
jgi:hypothetical protein